MKTEWEKSVIAKVLATWKAKAAAGDIMSVWFPVSEPKSVQAVRATQAKCKQIREMSATEFQQLMARMNSEQKGKSE